MASAKIPKQCPSCEAQLRIERMACSACGTSLEGDFLLPRLARLGPEDQQFLELFVLSSGSLKSVSKQLGLSYPTIRKRLDELVSRLEAEIERDQRYRKELLKDVENGKRSARDAADKLENI